MCAAYKIKPLLHLVLEYEVGIFFFSLSLEEKIEVKLVELALQGNPPYIVGYLIGHHDHFRQGKIRIIGAFPISFSTLFVGICPVEYLLLDKLTAVDSAERRSRQIKIILRFDRQKALVYCVSRFLGLVFLHIEIAV